MHDGAVGRLLVASLHQGIADLMPSRLEFYESWLSPAGLRDGRIGLAPLAAALSFLRQEGDQYQLVAARAGEYTAEWTVAGLRPVRRAIILAAPPMLRLRLVAGVARQMVRSTYGGSRVIIRWRKGRAAVDLRGSLFCGVRARAARPLCDFYAAALRRLLHLFNLDAEVDTNECRATGCVHCLISVTVREQGTV